MKNKLLYLALILFLGIQGVKSQDIPPPNPGLVINIVSGYSIEFVFDQIDEYINGIPNSGQSTFIRIGAIYDWKLQFKADQLMFYGTNDVSHQMELNNVGVKVEDLPHEKYEDIRKIIKRTGYKMKKDAIEWQYGMKQIAEFIINDTQYDKVYMTKDRQQPYIFILNYLNYPVYDYLKTVKYDETQSKSYNVAESFGKFQFSNWDPIESLPIPYVLYVLTPSQYDGLRYRSLFDIKDLIKYPDGSDAYFLVEAKNN